MAARTRHAAPARPAPSKATSKAASKAARNTTRNATGPAAGRLARLCDQLTQLAAPAAGWPHGRGGAGGATSTAGPAAVLPAAAAAAGALELWEPTAMEPPAGHLEAGPWPSSTADPLGGWAAGREDGADVRVLEPGLVLIRGCVGAAEQRRLADDALAWGEAGDGGFYEPGPPGGGGRQLNADVGRGRIYDAAARFPPAFVAHSARASGLACAADAAMPPMRCTHVLVNMYAAGSAGLVWHRDIYENDGRSDHPVVNLCVGASCVFGVRCPGGRERRLTLRSGDCLIFGGPCRFVEHAVLEVLLHERPRWMPAAAARRFSFTFRDSPEVEGREAEFRYFKPAVHLVGQAAFDGALLPAQATQAGAAVS
jgi:alkylated DNA repair protein (DNA oxidative demethylase)